MTGHARILNRDTGSGEWGSAKTCTVVGGEITVKKSCWYKIATGGGPATVHTVNGLSEGDEVMLSIADAANPVTLEHGTGNLDLTGDLNIPLNELRDRAKLMHDGSNLVEASSRP